MGGGVLFLLDIFHDACNTWVVIVEKKQFFMTARALLSTIENLCHDSRIGFVLE